MSISFIVEKEYKNINKFFDNLIKEQKDYYKNNSSYTPWIFTLNDNDCIFSIWLHSSLLYGLLLFSKDKLEVFLSSLLNYNLINKLDSIVACFGIFVFVIIILTLFKLVSSFIVLDKKYKHSEKYIFNKNNIDLIPFVLNTLGENLNKKDLKLDENNMIIGLNINDESKLYKINKNLSS